MHKLGTWLSASFDHTMTDGKLVYYLELGVNLGHLVSQYLDKKEQRFIEIGCGLAIPSLTLLKLGFSNGEAFDSHTNSIILGQRLNEDLGLNLEYTIQDFFKWKPKFYERPFLIADKPRGSEYDRLGNYHFEQSIVDFAIEKDSNLAIVPCKEEDMEEKTYLERCNSYIEVLESKGYQVNITKASPVWIDRVIIAKK